jgi:hypothetical protein
MKRMQRWPKTASPTLSASSTISTEASTWAITAKASRTSIPLEYVEDFVVREMRAARRDEQGWNLAHTKLHTYNASIKKKTDINSKLLQESWTPEAQRKQEAAKLRAEGEEQSLTIRAQADRESTVIVAEAERDAQQLRGEGDAQAAAIYGKAGSADPSFYAFYRSLEAYGASMTDGNGVIVLDKNDPFLQYMKNDR